MIDLSMIVYVQQSDCVSPNVFMTLKHLSTGDRLLLILSFRKMSEMPSGCPLAALFIDTSYPLVLAPRIGFVTISDFSYFCQIYLAIMKGCDGRLDSPDELVFGVDFGIKKHP